MRQPLHYDFPCPAAKDTSITHAGVAPSNLNTATTMRSAGIDLRNTLELRAKALEILAPKPDLGSRTKKGVETLVKMIFKKENHQRQI